MDFAEAIEHARRETLMSIDPILSIRLHGYKQTFLKDWEPLETSLNYDPGHNESEFGVMQARNGGATIWEIVR